MAIVITAKLKSDSKVFNKVIVGLKPCQGSP